ncbi:MAG: hydroxyethylthiazole kinase [Blautia sp.]
MQVKEQIGGLLRQIRAREPLIHHITNYVTANDCANAVLAIGASPIMADDGDEVEEIVSLANALVLNMGTLNQRTVTSMIAAGGEPTIERFR